MKSAKPFLLDVASKTFGKHGFYKTSMQQIAQGARKAKASLYYHFDSKEDLFAAVVSHELAMVREELIFVFADRQMDNRNILKTYMLRRMALLNTCINYQETLRPEFYEYYQFVDSVKQDHFEWEKKQILELAFRGLDANELELSGDVSIHVEVLLMLLQGLENDFFVKKEYGRLKDHLDSLANVIIKGISKN